MALLSLTACAGNPDQLIWYKQGASEPEQQSALYECERDTRMASRSFGSGVGAAGQAEAFYGRCMGAKGFSLVRSSRVYTLPSRPVTPQRDATGRTYGDNDRVMCRFPGIDAVNLQAHACAQGGGTIEGPA